jgi:hypothetical protein
MYKLWFLTTILYFHYKLEYLLALSNLYLFKSKKRKFASSRRLLMLFWFCVFFSLKLWKHFCTSANWIHVDLRIVNNSSFVSLNVPICCSRNPLLKKTTLMGIKKPINNDQSDIINMNMQRTALCWIENDDGWFSTSGKCVVLCEYVLDICREDT